MTEIAARMLEHIRSPKLPESREWLEPLLLLGECAIDAAMAGIHEEARRTTK